MSRCIDCHWFTHAPPVGRKAAPCSDLGELAHKKACDNFSATVEKGNPDPTITPVAFKTLEERKGYLGSLMDEPFAAIFHEILAEDFALSQDIYLAVKTVQAQLQAQGANIDAPGDGFNRTAARLLDLLVTYRLACAIGLGRYVDKIMEREIILKFMPRATSVPAPKKV